MAGVCDINFSDLAGWLEHDHEAAFAAFLHSAHHLTLHQPNTKEGSVDVNALMDVAAKALAVGNTLDATAARRFFESHFRPVRLNEAGLMTGYYEPVFEARRTRNDIFRYPLYKRPADLVPISTQVALAEGFTAETSFARQTSSGLRYHLSRGEVMAGGLTGLNLELVWLRDPFEAYIIHIQGSARLALGDGSHCRVAFDGKSGHPYRSLGKFLIERGVFTPQSISMDRLIDHLRAQGQDGLDILAENPSHIFFKDIPLAEDEGSDHGPVSASQVPLLPLRSIAIDRHIHTYGLPFWIETKLPVDTDRVRVFNQLVFAHDTGSAIKGAARADLYIGTGAQAGQLAGKLQQDATFTALIPIAKAESEA